MIENAAKFRHWVVLEDYTEITSDLGQRKQAFTFIDQFWASLDQLSGEEKLFVTQLYASATHKICCRDPGYRITAVMRFLYVDIHGNLRAFNILASENKGERGLFYECVCKEVLNESGVVMPPLPVVKQHQTDAFLVLALPPPAPPVVNLLVNGDFSANDTGAPWVLTNNAVITNGLCACQSLVENGQTDTVSQTVTTTLAGHLYMLAFDWCSLATVVLAGTLIVRWNGVQMASFQGPTNSDTYGNPPNGFVNLSIEVVGTGNDTVQFEASNSQLDNIVLSAE